MREDIRGGLRNALDRGESLEEAVRSFVQAGYKESEVRAEAEFLGGAMSMTQGAPVAKEFQNVPSVSFNQFPPQQLGVPSANTSNKLASFQQYKIESPPKKRDLGLILLLGALVLLIGVLIVSLVFRERIINFLSSFM